MTQTLVGQQPTDSQELAKRVRSHPFVDGPTRKLVRSWIQREPPQPTAADSVDPVGQAAG
jgi:hypothetical protein